MKWLINSFYKPLIILMSDKEGANASAKCTSVHGARGHAKLTQSIAK